VISVKFIGKMMLQILAGIGELTFALELQRLKIESLS